jgi:hypothetical protein
MLFHFFALPQIEIKDWHKDSLYPYLNFSVPVIHSGSHPTSDLLGSGKFLYVVEDPENKKRGMESAFCNF